MKIGDTVTFEGVTYMIFHIHTSGYVEIRDIEDFTKIKLVESSKLCSK